LLNLEKIESKLATIIDYTQPQNTEALTTIFQKFFENLGD